MPIAEQENEGSNSPSKQEEEEEEEILLSTNNNFEDQPIVHAQSVKSLHEEVLSEKQRSMLKSLKSLVDKKE